MKSNAVLADTQKSASKKSAKKARQGKASAGKKRPPLKALKKSAPKPLTRAQIDELIVSHTDHGERLARSFLNRWRVKMHSGEITSVVGVALCEAANRFDNTRGVAFKTFFFYHLRGLLIKEIIRLVDEQKICQMLPQPNSSERPMTELAIAEIWPLPVVERETPEFLFQRNQLSKICWEVCGELDKLEQDVVIRYFIFDQPLNSIAKELGYCRCHISRVKSRALNILSSSLKERLPDYRFSLLDQEVPLDEMGRPTDQATQKRRKYKGGRGRRKSASESESNVVPFRKVSNE